MIITNKEIILRRSYKLRRGGGYDAHHTLPKSKDFAEFFDKVGLDVNDPANMVWRSSIVHSSTKEGAALSKKHSDLWRVYIDQNVNNKVEVKDVLKQRDLIEKKVWGNTQGETIKQ